MSSDSSTSDGVYEPITISDSSVLTDDSGCVLTGVGSALTITGAGYSCLSPEQREELEKIQKQRAIEIKQLQREKFKQLPHLLREQVVQDIEFRRLITDIENTEDDVPKSTRQVELENMQNPCFFGSSAMYLGGARSITDRLLTIFNGDEIIEMHNDIEAEKALLED
jgi:hypothetical protein